jgi:prophage DNA circulation protein
MGTFRDWPRTLRRASYRGVSFFVESDKLETGRRLVVHEFPLRDTPYVEDLGRSANKIDVTAYVVGDNADGAESALRAACEAGGAATLNLPIASLLAHCEKCSRDFHKDKLGYIAFSLSFVRDGSGAAPFPIAYLGRLIETAIGGIIDILSDFFRGGFSTLDYASYVADESADELRSIAGQLDSAFRSTTVSPETLPTLLQQVGDIYSDAPTLVSTGERGDYYGGTSFVAQQAISTAGDIVTRLGAVFETATTAIDPELLAKVMLPLTNFIEVSSAGITPSRQQLAKNIALLRTTLRILALTALANSIVNRTFADRREAIQARADAAEVFGNELERISAYGDYDLYVAVQKLSGNVADYLSRMVADLAPVVQVSAPKNMPSLWWSQRLYGTADRATELASRNSVKHPSFMPLEFEALSD